LGENYSVLNVLYKYLSRFYTVASLIPGSYAARASRYAAHFKQRRFVSTGQIRVTFLETAKHKSAEKLALNIISRGIRR